MLVLVVHDPVDANDWLCRSSIPVHCLVARGTIHFFFLLLLGLGRLSRCSAGQNEGKRLTTATQGTGRRRSFFEVILVYDSSR